MTAEYIYPEDLPFAHRLTNLFGCLRGAKGNRFGRPGRVLGLRFELHFREASHHNARCDGIGTDSMY
jgi:hypothetical protein